jgi:hypothetical protein
MDKTIDRPAVRGWFVRSVLVGLLAGSLSITACDPARPERPGVDDVQLVQRAIGDYNFSDHVAWSQNPPGGLTPSQVPQFVQIGFDDNQRSGLNTNPPSGMTWATSFFKNLQNPAGSGNAATFDGTSVRVSFYSNTTYISNGFVEDPVLVKQSWRTAVTDGHEIGNHTHSHSDGGGFSVAQWQSEMSQNNDWLTRAFVPNEAPFSVGSGIGASLAAIEGFRAPFLSYNINAFTAMRNAGFTYDISIEEGWQLSDDGINFNWPYTLDNGSPGGTAVGRPSGNHSGLWELGAAPFVIPPALRAQLGLSKITGLDYNMFISAHLSKAQALSILKYTLDQRLASNRAPLFVGAHTAIYTSDVSEPNSTPQSRRETIQEFVTYALSKPQVRIVTAQNVIQWMRNPVALGGGGGCTPESDSTFCARLGKNCGTVSGNDNCGNPRSASCGSCTAPQTCGGGGVLNVCGSPANGDRTEGGSVSASPSGSTCSGSQTATRAYDNLMTQGNFTKWCLTVAPSTGSPARTVYDFSGSTAIAINRYTITNGDDNASRDPRNWTFQGCQASCTAGSDTGWVTLDTRTNQFTGAPRFQTLSYTFSNTTAYQKYRLRVTANNGSSNRFQMGELQMFGSGGGCTPENDATFCARLGKNCGTVTGTDNCGNQRTVSSCGSCTPPQTCGGGGTPNVCGGGGTGNCGAPPWAAGVTYSAGAVVTADCQVSIPGTVCFNAIGALYAWRCDVPTFCNLRPGSNMNGWWSAWSALQKCN